MATLRFNRSTRSNSVSSARDANNTAATTSGASVSSGNSSKTDSMKFVQKYLDGCRSFYSCIYCRTHLANHDELISRSFQGNRSRAYLFNTVINVSCGPSVQRELNTGAHSVADIFCTNCGTTIGWKYERAFVESQKYKEGKFIIELAHVVRENRHLELDKRDIFLGLARPAAADQQRLDSPATIGTDHQGSLSPASSSGQWSPGTSSSSSSSPSSSASPSSSLSPPSTSHNHNNHHRGASPKRNCRHSPSDQDQPRRNCVAGRYNEDRHDLDLQADDIDDDEVLMFPFYDDLYGNRSSYSNLSASRSYQRNMQRRSLYLEASPSNRRRSANSSGQDGCGAAAAGSSSSSVSPSAASYRTPLSGHTQPHLFSRSSRSIEIPFNHTSQAQTDNNSSCRQQQLAANKRFFAAGSSGSPPAHRPAAEPSQPTPQASSNSLATVAAAQEATRNNSEHVPDSGTSAAHNDRAAQSSRRHAHEDDTQFQFEHDNNKQQEAYGEGGNGEQTLPSTSSGEIRESSQDQHRSSKTAEASRFIYNSSSPGPSGETDDDETIGAGQPLDGNDAAPSAACHPIARSNSLSFDDEEFYDCNTDHDVSNSTLKPK